MKSRISLILLVFLLFDNLCFIGSGRFYPP